MVRALVFSSLVLLLCEAGADSGQPQAAAAAGEAVRITVQERAGVARTGEYVGFGVPIPRAWQVAEPSRLRLRDQAGKPIPAQFEVLARWGGPPGEASRPVKWVLVGCLASVGAGAGQTLLLDAAGPGPAPEKPIRIDTATPGKMTIDTGAAKFELNTSADFNLLHQVTVAGRALLQPLSAAEAIRYRPAGKLGVVEGGTPDLKPRATSVKLERAGPLAAVAKVMGSILDESGKAPLDFTARMYFTAGRPDVRVDFTVENNHPVLADENGQPTNAHNQGAVNSVYIGELTLNLRLAKDSSPLVALTEKDLQVTSPKAPLRLYQDSSGTESWNVYVGKVGWPDHEALAHPRLQSYCTRKGYEISGGGLA
ncbi:MAG: hypothetical protein AMJ81_04510, partial [Phycisphaerae bacterium SM23_33]